MGGEKDKPQDSAQGGASGYSKHLWTGKRITKQGLEHDTAGRHTAAMATPIRHALARAIKNFRVRIRANIFCKSF